ncbi:hypothetical protein [Pseudoneobacillus sp. C159]
MYISIFVVVLNVAGVAAVKWYSRTTDKPAETKVIKVAGVEIKLVNEGHYQDKLVKDIADGIKQAMTQILSKTEGKLTPNSDIQIRLAKSKKTTELNRPAYATTTIYNPDELYLDQWNFNEMMLHAMLSPKDKLTPFQTISLAEFLTLENRKEVDYYSAHEMWIVHRRHHKVSSLEELVQADVFKRRITVNVEFKGHYSYLETGYWKVASFGYFLIEKYGVNKFLLLYKGTDIVGDLENIYGKSFANLEEEWTKYVQSLENDFPEKYDHDLEKDYQYWYEN